MTDTTMLVNAAHPIPLDWAPDDLVVEKKLFVEASASQARVLAKVGVDGIQFDKVPVGELAPLVFCARPYEVAFEIGLARRERFGSVARKHVCRLHEGAHNTPDALTRQRFILVKPRKDVVARLPRRSGSR